MKTEAPLSVSMRCNLFFPLLLALAAAACAPPKRTVVAQSEFPTPVVRQQPYSVGLLLESSLASHTHSETLPDGSQWTVQLGQANAALFSEMCASLFRAVQRVQSTRGGTGQLHAVIKPVMQEYQFSTPAQSKTEYFETWIKYELELYDNKGNKITNWPFTAYGRSREGESASTEQALQRATRRAMRDAAAAVTLEFMRQPAVESYFQGGGDASTV